MSNRLGSARSLGKEGIGGPVATAQSEDHARVASAGCWNPCRPCMLPLAVRLDPAGRPVAKKSLASRRVPAGGCFPFQLATSRPASSALGWSIPRPLCRFHRGFTLGRTDDRSHGSRTTSLLTLCADRHGQNVPRPAAAAMSIRSRWLRTTSSRIAAGSQCASSLPSNSCCTAACSGRSARFVNSSRSVAWS